MEHFTQAVCILDTSSIINLDGIELARRDVLYYVRRFFNVRVCQAICEEFDRHRNLLSSRESNYWHSFLRSRRYTPAVLTDDATITAPFYTAPPSFRGADNAGEHGNARIALELVTTRAAGHAIFVTDDENACNAFLVRMGAAFPGIHLWSSADVILYLGAVLLTEHRVLFEDVRAALRDVYASRTKLKPWDQITQAEKDALIRKQTQSVDYLKLVSTVVGHWRN